MKKHTIATGIGLFTLAYQSLGAENFPITTDFGRTGLISIPSAHTIQDGNLLFGFSRTYPYTRCFLGFGFIPRFEGGVVITQVDNISFKNDPIWRNYGKYKDKAFFAKFQLIPETETL
ncbi:YjbH domain-containing protein, partial [Sulfurihydrogenibium sp.]|uniref:YjbH domain-containing protein n=1 Tax=Sulfurihydrogenibium sp. TaxID=2053621 RepID=UPI00261AD9E6